MKKLGVVLMAVLAIGCGKEELIPNEASEVGIGSPKQTWGLSKQLWVESKERNPWSDDDGGDITCVPPASNCYDEVIVVGMVGQPNDWDTFLSYYNIGKVHSYFNNERWDVLFPGLSSRPSVLSDLKNQVSTITLSRYTSPDSVNLCIAHKSGIDLTKFDAAKDVIFASPIKIK